MLLCLVMLFGMLPMSALADEGTGTPPVQTEAPVSTPEAAPEGSPAPTAEASPEVSSTPAPETGPEVSPTPAPEASPEVSPTPTPSTEVPMDEVLDELETVETPPAAVSSVENGFGHKILHLDCGRKYFTKEWIIALIHEMAAAGYNELELDFSNNEGFRFALDDMDVTFMTASGVERSIDLTPALGGDADGSATDTPWLTQADMDEILSVARGEDIAIVPLLNSPGHLGRILDTVAPEYRYQNSNSLDITSDDAKAFGIALIQKYAAYFADEGCEYFNMGCDEFANDLYSSGGMGFGHLVSAGRYGDFADYVNSLAGVLKSLDLTPRAFNDGIYYNNDTSVSFDQDIQVCYWSSGWNGYAVGSAATIVEEGHAVINTNGDYYYVLGKRDKFDGDKTGSGADTFRNYTFMGTTFDEDESLVIGSMFCIWCDYPAAESETEIATNVRQALRVMGGRMDKKNGADLTSATVSNEAVPGGFNANGTIYAVLAYTYKLGELTMGAPTVNAGGRLTLTWSEPLITATGDVAALALPAVTYTVSRDGTVLGTTTATTYTVENAQAGAYTVSAALDGDAAAPVSSAVTVTQEQLDAAAIQNGTITGGGTADAYELSDVSNGGQYLIVYQSDSTSGYALKNDGNAVAVTIADGRVVSEVTEDMLWTYTEERTEGWFGSVSYSYYLSSGNDYLYPRRSGYGSNRRYTLNIDNSKTEISLSSQSGTGAYQIANTSSNSYVSYSNGSFGAASSGTTLYFYEYTAGTEAWHVDTEALDAKLAALAAEGLQADDYTSASWSAYTAALDAAQNLTPNTTAYPSAETAQAAQDAIDAALSALNTAYAGLVRVERVTIAIHCMDGSGNRVAADTTVRVEKGVSQTITAPAIANYTATGMTSVTQTWTADSEVTFTYLLTPTGDPLTIEYWITNVVVTGSNGVTSKEITVAEAYGAEGVEVAPTYAPTTGTSSTFGDMVYWKSVRLDSAHKQTSDSGDDETASGTDLTKVRYYNDSWQYYTTSDEWKSFAEGDQLVAYYLQKTEVTQEITTLTKDWGYGIPSEDTSDQNGQVALSFAVVYPDGSLSPATESLIYANCTTIFNYWSNRDIGIIAPQSNADYDIEKITVTRGSRHSNTSSNTWGASDSIDWNKVTDSEGTQWYDETTAWDDSMETSPAVYGSDGYVWSRKNTAFLILIYLKPRVTDTSLTVRYVDDTDTSEIYSYPVAVTNGITFLNGLKNTGTVQSGTITLDDGAYITNSSGVDQTFNKNLATIPNLAGKYASGYYQYVSADVSEDGKTLTLHYQPSAEVLTFVVDFGLPLNITPNDLGLENADAVTGLTCNTSKGTYGIFSSSGTTVTYTPNETIDGAESVVLTIHYSGSTVTKQIRILPASVVYYEDSFATYDSSWSGTGTLAGTAQTAEKLGAKQNLYGYDPAYTPGTGFSMGSAHTVTVNTANDSATASFSFKGTGFDLISRTDSDSGVIFIEAMGTRGTTKRLIVDNYYGYDFVNGAFVTADKGSIEQVPVAKLVGLPYDTYDVTVTVVYHQKLDHTGDSSYSFWLDGIRVYDPMGSSYSAYASDSEAAPQYVELRKSLLNAAALTSGAVVQGTTFIDGKGETAVLADYESYGPNNEVYLSKGQSITFTLGSVDFADIQLGASLTGSAASTITVNGTTIRLDSATNLYYSIKNAIGTDKVVTITNTGDGMVALTNLKATGGTATLNLYSSQAAVGKVLAAMQTPGTGNQ